MPAIEGNVTRCDVRVPNELYEQIESLAVESGAKIHHRSGKPEVTATILRLIEIGLKYRNESDSLSDSKAKFIPDNVSDKLSEDITKLFGLNDSLDQRVNELESLYQSLSDNLSANITDKKSDNLPDNISDKFEQLQNQIKELKQQLGENVLYQDALEGTQTEENEQSHQVITKKTLDPIFVDSLPDNALSQSDLAKHLGVDDSTVKRNLDKGDEKFKQWSTEKDPEGKSWQFIGEFKNPTTQRQSKFFKRTEN